MSLAKKEIKVLEISYRNIFIYNLPKSYACCKTISYQTSHQSILYLIIQIVFIPPMFPFTVFSSPYNV